MNSSRDLLQSQSLSPSKGFLTNGAVAREFSFWISSAAVVLVLAVSGCSKATPAGPAGDSAAAVKLPGVTYWNDRQSVGPFSIHIARIDRSQADFVYRSTLARNMVFGLDTLSHQLRTIPESFGKPVAAINGDFYVVDSNPYQGDPRGLQVLEGELVSSPSDQVVFWVGADSQPHIGRVDPQMTVTLPDGTSLPFRVNEERSPNEIILYTPRLGPSTRTTDGREYVLAREGDSPWLPLAPSTSYTLRVTEAHGNGDTSLKGDRMVLSVGPRVTAFKSLAVGAVLKLSTALQPDMAGVRTAVGGGNIMVHNGKLDDLKIPVTGAYKYRSVGERHPRSAVGFNATHLFLVEVDGRQPDLSVGMTLRELGKYMLDLGCQEAMNFDGGGSSTLWVDGRVVNSPSNGGERVIGNGLAIVRKSSSGTAK